MNSEKIDKEDLDMEYALVTSYNVIAVSCWYGELRIEEDSWIYQWI